MKNSMTAPILSRLIAACPFAEIYEDTEPSGTGVFTYPRKKIVHIRADHDGWRWWNTVWPFHDELATEEMKREIDATYDALTAKDALRDLPTLQQFCAAHPDACVGTSGTEFNFYLEGELCNYWFRLITRKGDYNIFLTAYAKEETK